MIYGIALADMHVSLAISSVEVHCVDEEEPTPWG
jgi:hypothetical protein